MTCDPQGPHGPSQGVWGGGPMRGLGSGHVTCGPMRGLDKKTDGEGGGNNNHLLITHQLKNHEWNNQPSCSALNQSY